MGDLSCEVILMGLGLDMIKTPILQIMKEALQEQPQMAAELLVSIRNIAAQKGVQVCTMSTAPGLTLDWEKELEYILSLQKELLEGQG